jgi:type VI secretion system secreted protein VgrG
VHLDGDAIDLVRRLLGDNPTTKRLGIDQQLRGTCAKRPYTVQWRESDLALIDRLLEHEGIAWFHAHDGDLVLCDHPDGFPRRKRPIPLRPAAEGTLPTVTPQREPVITTLVRRLRLANREAEVHDWNWRTPDHDLRHAHRVADDPVAPRSDWAEHHADRHGANRLARLRAEELASARHACHGAGDHPALAPGLVIDLQGDGRRHGWLITSVSHEATQRLELGAGDAEATIYRNAFTCHDASKPWRPPRVTPRPVIPGVITAHIDGLPGDPYAQPDERGCYRVKLALDRSDRGNGRASLPVRAASPSQGDDHGFHLPLHRGSDVLLYHINGDPDRPVIAGCVPDPANPPVVTDDNRQQSRWKSKGENELIFDDTVLGQQVILRAAKHRRAEVKGDDDVQVAGNRTEAVAGSLTRSVGGDQNITITRSSTETVVAAKAVTVGGGLQVSVAGAKAEQVGGVKSVTIAGAHTVMVGADASSTVAGDQTENTAGGRQLRAKKVTVLVMDELSVTVGLAGLTLKKNGEIVLKGTKITIDGSSKVVVKGGKIAGN